MSNWHSLKIEEILDRFGVELYEGLSVSEASSRLEQYGENEIEDFNDIPSSFLIFFSQFSSFSSIILSVIAIILIFFDLRQALFVIGVLILSVVFGYIQQSRTESWIRTIFKPHSFNTRVVRGGRILEVESELVVPGDLIIFESGDYIPADARLVESDSLTVDESAITQEFGISEKAVFVLQNENAPISERSNMVYGGSYVIEGKGIGLVVATGSDLEINKTSSQTAKDNLRKRLETSVHMQLNYLKHYFEFGGIILALLLITVAWIIHSNIYEVLSIGLSAVLASIPIGILKITNYALVSTAFDMFKNGAKVKSLKDIESLAKTDTLCTKIRGYFTDKYMRVSEVFINGQILEEEILNNYINKIHNIQSNIEESANISYDFLADLHLLLIVSGLIVENTPDELIDTLSVQSIDAVKDIIERTGSKLDNYNRIFRMVEGIPYSSDTQQRSIILKNVRTSSHMILTLGDTQTVIESCSKIRLNGSTRTLQEETVNELLKLDQYFKKNSTSVLSVAYKNISSTPDSIRNEQHSMIFLGMLAFEKHVREGVRRGIEICKNAGIKYLAITDENPENAFDEAQLLGITDDRNSILDCQRVSENELWNNERYLEFIDRAKVFSKPTLENKHKILSRLKNKNRYITMTIEQPEELELKGNSVDISIAVPSIASDVAVNEADLLVYENGFKTIVDAITLAKETYYTLRNSIRWILSSAVGQLLTLLIGCIIYFINPQNFTIPFTLSQIVWINLLVNIIPSFALSKSSVNNGMFYTRYKRAGDLVLNDYRWDIILRGIIVASITLISFIFTAKFSVIEHVQTATCTTLILTQFMTGLQCYKYPNRTGLKKRIITHKTLWTTVLACIVIHLATIYIPFTKPILNFIPLDIEWLWILPFWFVSILSVDLTNKK